MDCSIFEDKLSDYLDDALLPSDASLFREHALQCRACRALLDELKSALSDCKDEIEAPAMLEAALLMIPSEHAPIDCFGFEELITEFLDGFVPAPVYHRFEEHAAQCEACSSLLTEIVYAIAACHSVHTYEEVDAPDSLINRLVAIMPKRARMRMRIRDRVTALVARMLPRPSQNPRWRLVTAAGLACATVAFLFLGFSDDGSVKGIFRQAQTKASELYDEGATKTDEVMASFDQVGKEIGGIWETLGGANEADKETNKHKEHPNGNKPVDHREKN
ncbi:MAG TPA: zf-HC2 domain-containing protein [Blastocatellia bacterium]|nr:zf-HC2 domain-containing protein [Blastocatellia bacterium]